MADERGASPAVTVTMPLVTIIPDHVELVLLEVTWLPFPSVNFQPETLSPDGPLMVQVVDWPLTRGEVQLSFATFTGALAPPPVKAGQSPDPLHWGAQMGALGAVALTVADPGLTPVTSPDCTVATEPLLLFHGPQSV